MRPMAFFIMLGVLTCFQVCSQDTSIRRGSYLIDPAINKEIKKKKISDGMASLDIIWLENEKAATFPLSSKDTPCYAIYSAEKDTIRIDIYTILGMSGIRISVYKDSCWIFHFVSSKNRESRNFKQNLNEKIYRFSPDAQAKHYKLVLVKELKPTGLIEGYVEFESVDFYQRTENSDKKRRYDAKGVFRAIKLL